MKSLRGKVGSSNEIKKEESRQVAHDSKQCNVQMIIAEGFKVNSDRAVEFRKWLNQIVKSDMNVAKNYLCEKEMRSLERIVSCRIDNELMT